MEKEINSEDKRRIYKRMIMMVVALSLLTGAILICLSRPLISGKTMVLSTRPVDPFDIMRGQYITIRYEIGVIPSIPEANVGDTVYVALKEDADGVWKYDKAYLNMPSGGDFIQGKISGYNGNKDMSLTYGIEQYFFERGASFSARNMRIQVKVGSDGQARISKLLDEEGNPLKIQYRDVSIQS